MDASLKPAPPCTAVINGERSCEAEEAPPRISRARRRKLRERRVAVRHAIRQTAELQRCMGFKSCSNLQDPDGLLSTRGYAESRINNDTTPRNLKDSDWLATSIDQLAALLARALPLLESFAYGPAADDATCWYPSWEPIRYNPTNYFRDAFDSCLPLTSALRREAPSFIPAPVEGAPASRKGDINTDIKPDLTSGKASTWFVLPSVGTWHLQPAAKNFVNGDKQNDRNSDCAQFHSMRPLEPPTVPLDGKGQEQSDDQDTESSGTGEDCVTHSEEQVLLEFLASHTSFQEDAMCPEIYGQLWEMADLVEADIPAGISTLTFKEIHCDIIIQSWHFLHPDFQTAQSLLRLPATAAKIFIHFWSMPEIKEGFWKDYPANVTLITNAFVQAVVEVLS